MTIKSLLILVFSLLFLGHAYASEPTWLCIGEKGAQVTKKNGVLGSESFLNQEKWIITSEGLKFFGSESVIFDNCNRDKNGRPHWCDRKDGFWPGNFLMDEDNVFVLSIYNIDDKNKKNFAWVIGRCSKI